MVDILLGTAIVLIITLGCGAFGLCFGYITHIEDTIEELDNTARRLNER